MGAPAYRVPVRRPKSALREKLTTFVDGVSTVVTLA